MRPGPNAVLGGRYELIRRIAVGGMGEAWEATDGLLDRPVAVKILKEEFRTASTFLDRFRAEARHAGRLSHRGIATVYDSGETDDLAFLVMELVRGRPLSELMNDAGDCGTTWELLSPGFRDARNLTFESYVSYRERTNLELRDLWFAAGPGADESRVTFEARYDTGSRVVDETDEITLRRLPDGQLIITEQRTV